MSTVNLATGWEIQSILKNEEAEPDVRANGPQQPWLILNVRISSVAISGNSKKKKEKMPPATTSPLVLVREADGSLWSRRPAKESSAAAHSPVAFPNQTPEPTSGTGAVFLGRPLRSTRDCDSKDLSHALPLAAHL
jgi:hypothetical protein